LSGEIAAVLLLNNRRDALYCQGFFLSRSAYRATKNSGKNIKKLTFSCKGKGLCKDFVGQIEAVFFKDI
jgi:hypothetical protein